MSERPSPDPHDQEATDEPKGGPSNPRGSEVGGQDAPTPPGGPQRQDAAGTGEVPDGRETDQNASSDGAGGSSTIPIEEEESHPERGGISETDALQEENAATSLDEPSENIS